ncbi:MAG: OmpA family protein [SAR324 cluster bacterium]|nr:OmpA family protein [SAR324 cluster bacterium]
MKIFWLLPVAMLLLGCNGAETEQKNSELSDLSNQVKALQSENMQLKATTKEYKGTSQELIAQDRLIKSLEKKLDKQAVKIVREDNRTRIMFPERLLFRAGEAQLAASGISLLNELAPALAEEKNVYILVAGHTDNRQVGPKLKSRFVDNLQLSALRAWHVVDFLRSQKGLQHKMAIVGYGDEFPVAKNSISGGRQENRRVSLTLVPLRNRPK